MYVYCTVFSVELFGVEVPMCTVIRRRTFVSIFDYFRVELVESVSTRLKNVVRISMSVQKLSID